MLGGGVFVTQNKVLPGSYINFVSASKASATLGERGTVAIALPIGKQAGKVITITRAEFVQNCKEIFGVESSDESMVALREIFCNSVKAYVYDLGSTEALKTVAEACAALEPYDFNILCAYTGTSSDITSYITQVKSWRDDMGKKCQLVIYNGTDPDYEGVINVMSKPANSSAPAHALVAWVAGAEAGAEVNESCTNMKYNGEYEIVCDKTQTALEQCIKDGELVFHLVYGDVCVLEDINSLVTTSVDKGEDFKSNQTMRVIDQIANDIAKLFNTKYLGKVPNNKSGRVSLWGDIVAHHRQLEAIQAIEDFDSSQLIVEQGNTKKSVVVHDVINVVNAMAQLYMTVVVA